MVDFSFYGSVHGWVMNKPREVGVVIAARAALRVIPTLALASSQRTRRFHEFASHDVLPTFRAAAVPWVAAKYPWLAPELRPIASAARAASVVNLSFRAPWAPAGNASAAANAAVASAYNASRSKAAIERATQAAAAAVDRVLEEAGLHRGNTSILSALSGDVSSIEGGTDTIVLAGQPLWPNGEPAVLRENWLRLKSELLSLNAYWEVWTEWYEARKDGRSAYEALETARIRISEEVWRQSPRVVNAEIKRLIALYEAKPLELSDHHQLPPLPEEPVLSATVPAQKPAAMNQCGTKAS